MDVTRYRIVYSTEVDCNTLKEEDGTIKLYVPITRKFMLAQSELICENLRDCELYTDLTREIIREKSANINLSIVCSKSYWNLRRKERDISNRIACFGCKNERKFFPARSTNIRDQY